MIKPSEQLVILSEAKDLGYEWDGTWEYGADYRPQAGCFTSFSMTETVGKISVPGIVSKT